MYCPSCDKTYGAIHSRCPECHSWLKVSAPPSASRKGVKAGAAPAAATPRAEDGAAVSTLDRDSGWADPAPPMASSAWTEEPNDSWSNGAAGHPAAPAAESDGWGGGANGWSDAKGTSDGWGGAGKVESPVAPPSSHGWSTTGDEDGWGAAGAGAEPRVESRNRGASGWLGDAEPPAATPARAPAPPASSGWLGDEAMAPSQEGRGWLGDGPSEAGGGSRGGGGWLGDSDPGTPSMTAMVDHAISVEEEDDFVDDSWVDEEIRDSDFDELDVPEYIPPAPEVGGALLKMILVAVLVVLVGGGVLFLKEDSATPQETEQAEAEKRLEFGRLTAQGGKADLEAGRPGLAVPQLQEAMVALAEGKAPQDEIYQTEVLLGRALMADEAYEEAYKHWKSLKNSGQSKYAAEADQGLNDTKRQLRIKANNLLQEAKGYAAKGEVHAVKKLGRDALEIYEAYGGNRGQLGNAHGMIGRGFLNGREYAVAREHLKKAVALAPGVGYETYLNQVNQALQPAYYDPPVQYHQPVRTSAPRPAERPRLDLGQPDYVRNTNPSAGGGRRSSSAPSNNSPAPAAAPAAPPRMKEIPIHRPTQRRTNDNQRKGAKGVLQGY